MGIAILVLLSVIIVAQVSKILAKKKSRKERLDEAMVNSAFSEEDERRTAWIDYYVANGQLDETGPQLAVGSEYESPSVSMHPYLSAVELP